MLPKSKKLRKQSSADGLSIISRYLRALCLLLLGCLAHKLSGAEPVDEFLSRLRDRQMHDIARVYLEQMKSSPLAPAGFAERIPLEIAQCYTDEALLARDTDKRKRLLREAIAVLENYWQGAKPSSAGMALVRLGNLQMTLGEMELAAGGTKKSAVEDQTAKDAARKLFEQSAKSFADAREKLRLWLAELPKEPTEQADKEQVDMARSYVVQARYYHPEMLFKQGKLLAETDPQRAQLLGQAAELFLKVEEDYSGSFAAGRDALMRKGECYSALGDRQKALGAFSSALDQLEAIVKASGMSPDIAGSYGRALALFMQEQLSDDKAEFAEAAKRGDDYLAAIPVPKRPDASYLAVTYWTAKAHQGLAKSLGNSPQQRAAKNRARDLARLTATHKSEWQTPAKTLITEITGKSADAELSGPETFTEAVEAARPAYESWLALASEASEAAEPSDQQVAAREEALEMLRRALFLVRKDTPLEEVNEARGKLSILYFDAKRFEEALVLGEFVARGFPQSELAPAAAKIALSSYRVLTSTNPLLRGKARSLADFTIEKWPTSKEAETALGVVIEDAADELNISRMRQLLERVENNSPRKPVVEMQAGQALWRALSDPNVEPSKKPSARLAAIEFLLQGLERRGTAQPNAQSAAATVVLCLLLLEEQRADEAMAWVEKPDSGVLAQVLRDNAPRFSSGLALEGLKASLRTYLSVTPPKPDQAELMMKRMDGLSKIDLTTKLAAQKALLGLGRDLSQQMQELIAKGRGDAAKSLAAGAEGVFSRVGAQPDAGYTDRLWVGGTLVEMADALSGKDDTPPAQAQGLYRLAAEQYGKILEQANTPNYLPKDARKEFVALRRVTCLRQHGQYDTALSEVKKILAERPNMLTAQMEAARILQASGKTKMADLTQAVLGDGQASNGKRLIWGWQKTAQVLARSEAKDGNLTETYFEVRYQLAKARMEMSRYSRKEASKLFDAARKDVLSLERTHGTKLSSSAWLMKFDELMRTIQQAQLEPATGLASAAQAHTKNGNTGGYSAVSANKPPEEGK